MEIFGIIFLCVVACLAVWCMAKFGVFAPCFGRLERGDIFIEKTPAAPQPEWVRFNLNDEIRVKLTERGFERMADLWNSSANMYKGWTPRSAEFYESIADKDGFVTMQVHQFMYKFGSLDLMLPEFVETSVFLSTQSLRNWNNVDFIQKLPGAARL